MCSLVSTESVDVVSLSDVPEADASPELQEEIVRLRIRWLQMELPVERLSVSSGTKALLHRLLCPPPLLRITAVDAGQMCAALLSSLSM